MVSVLPKNRTRGARKGIPVNVMARLMASPAKKAENIAAIIQNTQTHP
jgi:hypothetical protein